MSTKRKHKEVPSQPVVVAGPKRVSLEVGPTTLEIFSQVLAQADISRAQVLTLLESKGLPGNYRLVITGARLEPVEAAVA